MSNSLLSFGSSMHVVDGVMVVQAPDSFDDESLKELRSTVLAKVHGTSVRGVIIDVSSLRILDSVSYAILADTARTLEMLGAQAVFSGFRAEVVAALIDLDVESDDITAVLDITDGLELLRPEPVIPDDEDDQEEQEAENAAAGDYFEMEGEDTDDSAPADEVDPDSDDLPDDGDDDE